MIRRWDVGSASRVTTRRAIRRPANATRVTCIALAVAVALGMGCGGGAQSVAVGPIDLGPSPKEVMFFGPVPAPGPAHELVFEFERPGDSHHAGGIAAVLVTPQGRRDSLLDASVDRRGEALVALRGRTSESGTSYRAVVLSSESPVRLREIHWSSGGK